WESTADPEAWFAERKTFFRKDCVPIAESLGKPFFAELRGKIAQASEWPHLAAIPSFDEIAARFRQTVDRFDTPLEKIYFLVYLLDLPGMSQLTDGLLWDINRLLRNIHKHVTGERLTAFAGNLMTLLEGLRSEHPGEVLDCLLTLGKELIDTQDTGVTDFFVRKLIELKFTRPGEIRVTSDWQIEVNVNHVKNIRTWLELVEYDPQAMKNLLPALVVNLRLGGIFISDTDLFQKDVTKLLNAEIGPVYKQVKDLARMFPVYFTEIGAEGELRDTTTAIDELSRRRDRLIHFLRKQTHTESNSTHVELARRIIRFWHDGDLEPLRKLVPADVMESIDLKSEWFIPVHEVVKGLCERAGCTPEQLLAMDKPRLDELLSQLPPAAGAEKERVSLLVRTYALLKEKYSFEAEDVIPILKRSRIFTEEDIGTLKGYLERGEEEAALRELFHLMDRLKGMILKPEPSEGWENIYYKRHVAAGIPSMYGEYREPKFEALGLTFRLEKAASRLMGQIVQDINLDYITAKTLRRVYDALALFHEGLELDGIRHPGLESNLKMLKSSFSSASFSLDQYANIFEFIEESVKEIIAEHFLRIYDPALRVIVPQLDEGEAGPSEAQMRETLHKRSEGFFREVLSAAFLIQMLDNFVSDTVRALRSMGDHLPRKLIRDVMAYDADLIISPLCRETRLMDNPIFLGAKAFFLKKLLAAGFPVPNGFVLTTEVFRHRQSIVKHPQINEEIGRFIRQHLGMLEQTTGRTFGDSANPLLLSVRAGTAISMPGAMATFLNVGMNDEIAEGLSRRPGFERVAWDSYRRFLQSWGMARGIERKLFDAVNARRSADSSPMRMKETVREYQGILESHGVRVETDPFRQLRRAILEVMDSWDSDRARAYREHLQIADEWGTAVIVQKMVFGNLSGKSGTGVLFTHDPNESKPGVNISGDFGVSGQGEDVVAGCLDTLPITEHHRRKYHYDSEISLESAFPAIYGKLVEISNRLVEEQRLGPQEVEFTFESEKPEDLYILQTRRMDIRKHDKRFVFSTPHDQMELVGR
ncbi:MAG: pyruvate phosphate dikinase, partial [Chloroflexi bacterium]|nr:pyruvate phosphate dikinase [Chloroflexota bacterium]